jgi:hypothetical protein
MKVNFNFLKTGPARPRAGTTQLQTAAVRLPSLVTAGRRGLLL